MATQAIAVCHTRRRDQLAGARSPPAATAGGAALDRRRTFAIRMCRSFQIAPSRMKWGPRLDAGEPLLHPADLQPDRRLRGRSARAGRGRAPRDGAAQTVNARDRGSLPLCRLPPEPARPRLRTDRGLVLCGPARSATMPAACGSTVLPRPRGSRPAGARPSPSSSSGWVMAVSSVGQKSTTFDELAHLTAGYSYWLTGDFGSSPRTATCRSAGPRCRSSSATTASRLSRRRRGARLPDQANDNPCQRQRSYTGCVFDSRSNLFAVEHRPGARSVPAADRKSTRLNSSHRTISYAVFCL